MDKTIAAWLRELDEDFMIAWANKGLLRRGLKLADSLPADAATANAEDCQAQLEGHQQVLKPPGGFEQLSCSCPAPGACHHLIGFLLCLKNQTNAAGDPPATESAERPPWLAEDLSALEQQLGKSYLKRAQQVLLQAPDIELRDSARGLVARITEAEHFEVRIPRSIGLRAATCSCKAERCWHKALAVLAARQQADLYDPLANVEHALSSGQIDVVAQLNDWLRELVLQGSAGLSRALLERGDALVTVARQADFPLLASLLAGLLERLYDELAGRSFFRFEQLHNRLAQLWCRLQALQQIPLPQPLLALAGAHKRQYRLLQNLDLNMIAAEAWNSAAGFSGLSLHGYDPVNRVWYRHTQARSDQQAEASNWTPQRCWQHDTWGRQRLQDLPLSRIRLRRGWSSLDQQLSGREGTLIERIADQLSDAELPICTDFARLWAECAQTLRHDPLLSPRPLPVLLKIERADAPVFDSLNQTWSQCLYDSAEKTLAAHILLADDTSAALRGQLDRLWRQSKRWDLIFGWLSQQGASLRFKPVSLRCREETKWRQLSLL